MTTEPNMKFPSTDEWVWIDDESERLIREIEAAPPSPDQQKVFDDLQATLLNTLIGPFGLSADLLRDVDGGNVTTLHNFEKGVTANAQDEDRHRGFQKARNERFDRSDYEAGLPKERKKAFQQPGPIVDAYTGNELPKDGRAHRDHVVSAAEIARSSKGHFAQSHKERVATANLTANKVWAEGSMNQSKRDKDLPKWADEASKKDSSQANAEAFGVDREAMTEVHENARAAVDEVQDRAVLLKNAKDLAFQGTLEGGKLALRQALGLAMRALLRGLIADVRKFAREGLRDVDHLRSVLVARANATIEEMKARWGEFLKEGLAAALAGLLSSIVTFIINSIITTVRNVVTIVRELIVALIRALKVVVAPEKGMTRSDIARAVLGIVGGAATTVIGLGAEEAIKKMLEAVPLLTPFAGELATVLCGALVGVGSILLLLAFDHLNARLAFRNKRLADVHRGQQVALLQIRKTCFLIETSREFILDTRLQLQRQIAASASEAQTRRAENGLELEDYTREVDGMTQLLRRLPP
jgi:hypothetical protein